MTLDLNDEQAAILAGVLRDRVGDLRMEIGKTDSHEWREDLKHQEELLAAVLDRLQAATAA